MIFDNNVYLDLAVGLFSRISWQLACTGSGSSSPSTGSRSSKCLSCTGSGYARHGPNLTWMRLTTRITPVPKIIGFIGTLFFHKPTILGRWFDSWGFVSASKYPESGSQGVTELQIRNPCSLDPHNTVVKRWKKLKSLFIFPLWTPRR